MNAGDRRADRRAMVAPSVGDLTGRAVRANDQPSMLDVHRVRANQLASPSKIAGDAVSSSGALVNVQG